MELISIPAILRIKVADFCRPAGAGEVGPALCCRAHAAGLPPVAPGGLDRGADRLGEILQDPEDAELRHAFVVWMKGVLFGRVDQSEIPGRIGLEEFRNMLEKTVQQWNRELREEGRQEGRQEGREQGRREAKAELLLQFLEQRFGPLDPPTLTRLRTAEEDQLQIWAGRLLTAASLEGVFEDEAH
jgi:transposase